MKALRSDVPKLSVHTSKSSGGRSNGLAQEQGGTKRGLGTQRSNVAKRVLVMGSEGEGLDA